MRRIIRVSPGTDNDIFICLNENLRDCPQSVIDFLLGHIGNSRVLGNSTGGCATRRPRGFHSWCRSSLSWRNWREWILNSFLFIGWKRTSNGAIEGMNSVMRVFNLKRFRARLMLICNKDASLSYKKGGEIAHPSGRAL